MTARRAFASWWTPAFARTFAAALFVWGAYWLAITVLQWHVADLPGTTPGQIVVLYFVQLSPMLFLTPFAGPVIDRVGGRPVLLLSSGLMTAIGAAGALLGTNGWLTYGMSAVLSASLGLCMAIGSPAVHAFVPTTVARVGLAPAVRSVAVSQNVARLLGPAVAGILLLSTGVPASLVVVCVVACAGLVVLLVRPASRANPDVVPAETEGALSRLFSGFRIASGLPVARRALLLTLANSVLGLSHVSMLPLVATSVLEVGEGGYAAMMAAGGAGAMLGAMFPLARMHTFRPISVLLALSAVALTALAFSGSLPFAVAASGVLGALGVMIAVSLSIHLQASIEQRVRGRVMSLFTWAWGGFLPIGGLLLGFVAGQVSVPAALVAAAVLLALVALTNLLVGRAR